LKGDFEGDFRRFSLIHRSHRSHRSHRRLSLRRYHRHPRGNPSAHSLRGVSLNSAAGKLYLLLSKIVVLILLSRRFLQIYNRWRPYLLRL
ncbi:unnamed protein product, partial [Brassica oleracea var. botrytis]